MLKNYRVNSLNQIKELHPFSKSVNYKPLDLMEKITSASNVHDIQSTLLNIMYSYGFSVSGCVLAAGKGNNVVHFLGNADKQALVDYYYACLPDRDGSLKYCEKNILPKVWGTKEEHEQLQMSQSPMADVIEACKLRYTITIPVHGPDTTLAGFRFGSNQGDLKQRDLNHSLPILHSLSGYFYEAIVRNLNLQTPAVNLSKKQIAVLTWISAGFNVSKIAEKMHISENTVLYHLKKIYLALNVHSKSHAVAKAIRCNLISP